MGAEGQELLPGTDEPAQRVRTRKTARRQLDRYDTPASAVEALLAVFPEISGMRLLDPCSGNGAMARRVGRRFHAVHTNDIDPAAPSDSHLDAADPVLYQERPDWVVTNPPFVAAGDITRQAIGDLLDQPRNLLGPGGALVGVAMLLRITFLEPCASSPAAPRNGRLWLGRRPPTAQLVLPRIDFRGDGKSDSATACWFIWSRMCSGIRVLTDQSLAEVMGQASLAGMAG